MPAPRKGLCDPDTVTASPVFLSAPFRKVRLGPIDCTVHRHAGSTYVRSCYPLASYPEKITERLDYWAVEAPDRTFFAERTKDGTGWRSLSFSLFRDQVRCIAQSLLRRGLSAERPIAILSGNDLEHALLVHAAMYAGIPFGPISASYSLISTDFGKLTERNLIDITTAWQFSSNSEVCPCPLVR